jgi:hypothetical protein
MIRQERLNAFRQSVQKLVESYKVLDDSQDYQILDRKTKEEQQVGICLRYVHTHVGYNETYNIELINCNCYIWRILVLNDTTIFTILPTYQSINVI